MTTRKSRRPRLDDDGLPFLPMWLAKWENRTAHLTIEEDGCYWRLIRLTWKTPGCSLPVDRDFLRRHMRVDDATYDRLVAPILTEFFTSDGGRWRNPKLTEVWSAQTDAHERRKDAGKRGGSATALKNQETGRNKKGSNEVASQSQSHNHNQEASKLASGDGLRAQFLDDVKASIGTGVQDRNNCGLEFAVDLWLANGASPSLIIEVVKRCTAQERPKPIEKLRAITAEVDSAIAAQLAAGTPKPPPAPAADVPLPKGPARTVAHAIVETHGRAAYNAWFANAEWNGSEVYAPDEFYRAQIDTRFGGILRELEYRVTLKPAE